MKTKFLLAFAVAAFLLTSCKNTPKNSTEVTDAKKVETTQGVEGTIDVKNSKILWTGTKPGGAHNGSLGIKSGTVTINDKKLVGGSFVLAMDSIVCLDLEAGEMNDKLVGHLKSEDFFDVAKFPEGKFVITGVEYEENSSSSCTISGNLTLKGVEKNISFKANTEELEGKGSATTETFSIDRTLWGVNYGSKNIFKDLKDSFINDNMEIQISIVTE